MKNSYKYLILFLPILAYACNTNTQAHSSNETHQAKADSLKVDLPFDSTTKVIHVMVALCDNKYQGIVPVPEQIGNGQKPQTNLYWGAAYGIKTYFKKSSAWQLLETRPNKGFVLERLIFKHKKEPFYMVADAYDGKNIKDCTIDFLKSSAGQMKDTLIVNNKALGLFANAKLLSYIGHDGLMDFQLDQQYNSIDQEKRALIILACYSKKHFDPYLDKSHTQPIVWSSHLMAPEAYVLHDALSAYIAGASDETIRTKAALAYAKYQKCSEKAARNLLISGW